MSEIGNLLVAVDLGPESDALIHRVMDLYRHAVHRINVVHVVRRDTFLSCGAANDPHDDAHARRMLDHVGIRVRDLFRRHGVILPSANIHVACGEPAHEIKKLAQCISAEVVIVGSHCKENDWLGLPGSTTNCMLQGMTSDVMALRV